MSNLDWQRDKERKKMEREQARLERALASPLSQGAFMQQHQNSLRNIASVAAAIEALELLLVSKGILKDDELMQRIALLMEEKADVAEAQQAQPTSSIISV